MSFLNSFFNTNEPLIRRKQAELDIQDVCGLLKLNIQIFQRTVLSAMYTRVDQAILLWAVLTLVIFGTAQFWPMSWTFQAILWSILTVVGVIGMQNLTWFWATVERLNWVVWAWAILMLLGVLITDLGIFLGIGIILVNLCSLWLAISGLGYVLTGLGLRSRTFLLAGCLQCLGIIVLKLLPGWPFLTTGFIIGGTLWLLSELQWDMRSPIEPALLTTEELAFNQVQQLRRTDEVIY